MSRRLHCPRPDFYALKICALAAILLFAGSAARAQAASIQFTGGIFRITGWKAPATPPANGWPALFSIYAGSGDVPALLGAYTTENGALLFRPRYPIAKGVHYRAVFKQPGGGVIQTVFDGPRRDTTPSAHVLHVYPSAAILPSNQLRLYINFSAAMSRGEAARHVRILDDHGKTLEGAAGVFLPGEELWDPDFRRLTLTLDPGRIKRGLTSNRKIGPPIAPGKRYTLVIDQGWLDAGGVPMTEGFQKLFRGGPAERNTPDPKQWRITAPKAGTADALVVNFREPMNFPLLQRMLQVTGAGGRVAGTVSIANDERDWRFTPSQAWKPGDYRLVVDTGLEDLAGNHIGQAFDIDTFQRVTEHITTTSISLPLAIR